MKIQNWGLLLFLGAVMTCETVKAEENYLPSLRQIQTFKDRSDCSIYAAIRGRTLRRYKELRTAQLKVKEFAKHRRETLVNCGAPSEASRRALQDEELASRCPKEFQEWLKSGENYLINQAELRETYRNLESLAGLIAYQCGRVPEVPDHLPPEPESTPAENPS